MREERQLFKYIFFDVVTALISWTLFYSFRKINWEGVQLDELYLIATRDEHYLLGFVFIPVFWCTLYFLMGQYKGIFRRHRVKEVGEVFLATVVGTLILFFVLITRLIVTSFTVKKMNSGEW